ncbi:hypothetical protein J1C56_29460 [Aminobacter anthyllidis]|uniref:Uncharacterized protein n=1 Tax=Aminobacter anthyllidis TaxID=1035067 RepID=A0A9X1AH62_9HYPH|nr:hypothetical protein [Aminobacter anthyllidis]MBT1159683.1 hypothetical protein [Aminobacter anthyllidis]MDH4987990.1 hypothetical protein [Aminobacter anthyllidis]
MISINWETSLCLVDMPEQKGADYPAHCLHFCDGGGACQATLLKRHVLKLKRYILEDIDP